MISFNWFRLQKALKTEQEEEEGGSKVDDVTKPGTDVEDVKAEIELELKEDEKFEIEEKNEVSTHCFNLQGHKTGVRFSGLGITDFIYQLIQRVSPTIASKTSHP